MKAKTIPLASLVCDENVYPRHRIDSSNVASLINALRMGVELPPIVADLKSKRVVDGFHRCRAYKQLVGPEAMVKVELIDYQSEGDLVFDAVQRNSGHGRKFDSMDLTRAVILLEDRGVSEERISIALHVPVPKVEKLRVRIANAPAGTVGTVPGTNKITLKRPVQHMANQNLTKKQAMVHQSLPGTSFRLIAQQLADALEAKMVPLGDGHTLPELWRLHEVLSKVLS